MPTGKITFPGGLSAPSIQVPYLPGSPLGVRGSKISHGGGVRAIPPQPSITIAYGTGRNEYYAGFVPEIAKANYLNPSNQGARAQGSFNAARQSACTSNSPSRSQFMEGYTQALQAFAASNTWQIAGQTSVGTRARQPSTKFVSPFSNLPIPVAMPWDL
uniref:Uncharacterized protein n=1 Tax=viral metagenome TaxID=1070528 RepID=A0A6M3LRE4_9ZZZZ